MFKDFKYCSIPLNYIKLDPQNPRIVTVKPLVNEDEIIEYFYENEDLEKFIQKIAHETKNPAAEKPYVVKEGKHYTVVEGNSRIAAYKVLTGLLKPPKNYEETVPKLHSEDIESLNSVDVAIAPNREKLMPILVNSHFGRGDKSNWTFLSSRKTIALEYEQDKNIKRVARIFNCKDSEVLTYLMEWKLYQEALKLDWSSSELDVLHKPRLEFNPPIRFFQTSGHTDKVGVCLDRANLQLKFVDEEARQKFRHLIFKLVINRTKGLTATSSYEEVFHDFIPTPSGTGGKSTFDNPSGSQPKAGGDGTGSVGSGGQTKPNGSDSDKPSPPPKTKKDGRLFSITPKAGHALLDQLFKEAKDLGRVVS